MKNNKFQRDAMNIYEKYANVDQYRSKSRNTMNQWESMKIKEIPDPQTVYKGSHEIDLSHIFWKIIAARNTYATYAIENHRFLKARQHTEMIL